MNIPPILERLLLSNEAVFKNASLGLSGQNMVYVPPGKTAVLLEFSIEPFSNTINRDVLDLFGDGVGAGNFMTDYAQLKERLVFQMQIINDTFSTYFSFKNDFAIKNNVVGGDFQASVDLIFKGKREELFIYADRSMYFNFIYPFYSAAPNNPGLTPLWGNPAGAFTPKIQDLPSNPITFKNNTVENFVVAVQTGASTDFYFPVGKQIVSSVGFDNTNQQEYLHFPNETYYNQSAYNTIVQPQANDEGLAFGDLFSLPLINVKYALINKRAGDYGIVAPKNL